MRDLIVPVAVILIVFSGAPPIGIAVAVAAGLLIFLGRKS